MGQVEMVNILIKSITLGATYLDGSKESSQCHDWLWRRKPGMHIRIRKPVSPVLSYKGFPLKLRRTIIPMEGIKKMSLDSLVQISVIAQSVS